MSGIQIPHEGRRISGDRYYTRDDVARACVSVVHALEPVRGHVLEPHVGGGAFARAILDLTPAALDVVDIDEQAPGLSSEMYAGRRPVASDVLDFLSMDEHHMFWPSGWIFMNPPYSHAEAHIRHGLRVAPRVVALVRLAILSGEGRAQRLHHRAPLRRVWVLAGRPSFTVRGTGRYDYALLMYDRRWKGPATVVPGWRWREAVP